MNFIFCVKSVIGLGFHAIHFLGVGFTCGVVVDMWLCFSMLFVCCSLYAVGWAFFFGKCGSLFSFAFLFF